jgi:hypothetical protein
LPCSLSEHTTASLNDHSHKSPEKIDAKNSHDIEQSSSEVHPLPVVECFDKPGSGLLDFMDVDMDLESNFHAETNKNNSEPPAQILEPIKRKYSDLALQDAINIATNSFPAMLIPPQDFEFFSDSNLNVQETDTLGQRSSRQHTPFSLADSSPQLIPAPGTDDSMNHGKYGCTKCTKIFSRPCDLR